MLNFVVGSCTQISINKLLKTEPCERHMFDQTGEIHRNRSTKVQVGPYRWMMILVQTDQKKKKKKSVIYPLLCIFIRS